MRTTVRTSLYVILNNKYGVRTNQNKDHSQNKVVCHLEKKFQNKLEQLLEQNPIIVGTILCVISNKNKCSVRTNQNKGQNKLLL
jgi:hypothetical protein